MAKGDRWLLVGDSIQTCVYAGSDPVVRADSSNLLATNLAKNTGYVIQNLSWGGARMTSGPNWPNFGWADNMSTIQRISSPINHADGVIITLGTNDWAEPSVSGIDFIQSYSSFIYGCQALGMKVVLLSPIWRSNEAARPQKQDGAWNFVEWNSFIPGIAANTGAKWIYGYGAGLNASHYVDGLHLNESGHIVLEAYVRTKMQALGYLV